MLDADHTGDVTLQAAPGAHVMIVGKTDIGGSHLIVRNLWIKGEVVLGAGASYITVDHNDITGGGEGVYFDTSDCTVPNAPKWAVVNRSADCECGHFGQPFPRYWAAGDRRCDPSGQLA